MTSGDFIKLGLLIAIATALGVMLWLVLRQGRRIAEISAHMDAEQRRQEELARKIVLPVQRTGTDELKKRRHLHIAPVIGFVSAAGGFIYSHARAHPAAAGTALSTLAGAGAVALTFQQPAVHNHPNSEPPTIVIAEAPSSPPPSLLRPVRTPTRTRETAFPPSTVAHSMTVPPSNEGPRQSSTAGPTDAPVSTYSPPSSASAPVDHNPPNPRPTPVPTPTGVPTSNPPPTTSSPPPSTTPPPSSSSPPPITPPPTKPAAAPCLIKLDALGILKVCVGLPHHRSPRPTSTAR